MDRRDFLKFAGIAGLSVASPFGFQQKAKAQATSYDGTFFVMLNASGGYDPTSLCDPKGMLSEEEENPMNRSYMAADIQSAGNIPFAPVGTTTDIEMSNADFFNKHYQNLLVINGVDTATNGHDSGSRHVWSGRLAEGYPAFGALVAASKARAAPMAFLSNGGYDLTQGLVAPTRSGNTGALQRIAYPHRMDTNNPDSLFHTEATVERIRVAQEERLAAAMATRQLPKVRRAMDTLYTARIGENEVRRLTDFLPESLDNSQNRVRRQAQIAIASYKAGLSVACNLNTGGFDTHGNHDAAHIPRLGRLLAGADFVMEEAERQGVADKVVVVIGSDFGRTPGYNDTNGKDHWSITSYMVMGAGVDGNRVVGGSTERHHPLTVNPETLSLDEAGVRITPTHIHKELRRLADITDDELANKFPLTAEDMRLFG